MRFKSPLLLMALIFVSVGLCMGSDDALENVTKTEIVDVADLDETTNNVTETEVVDVADLNETAGNASEIETVVVVESPEAVKDVEISVEAVVNLTESSNVVVIEDSNETNDEYIEAYREGYVSAWMLANNMGQLSGFIEGMGTILEHTTVIAPFMPETYNGMAELYNDAVDQYNAMALMSNLMNAIIADGNETMMEEMWLEEKDYIEYYYY